MGQLKILVVGANGFIGSNLMRYLDCNKFRITPIYSSNNIDFTNVDVVNSTLNKIKPDVVINCLSYSVRHASNESDEVGKNLSMFYSFYKNQNLFKQYINIGSGAEFDKSTNINNVLEIEITHKLPKDSYGYAKNIIARSIQSSNDKFVNLRIFGCFGNNELETRLLKRYVSTTDQVFYLNDDRYFDYISVQDYVKIVEYVIENRITKLDCNCVYENKLLLSEFLSLFSTLKMIKTKIIVQSTSEYNYTANSTILNSLNLRLLGLENGLKKYL